MHVPELLLHRFEQEAPGRAVADGAEPYQVLYDLNELFRDLDTEFSTCRGSHLFYSSFRRISARRTFCLDDLQDGLPDGRDDELRARAAPEPGVSNEHVDTLDDVSGNTYVDVTLAWHVEYLSRLHTGSLAGHMYAAQLHRGFDSTHAGPELVPHLTALR